MVEVNRFRPLSSINFTNGSKIIERRIERIRIINISERKQAKNANKSMLTTQVKYFFILEKELDILIITDSKIILINRISFLNRKFQEFNLSEIKEIKAKSK